MTKFVLNQKCVKDKKIHISSQSVPEPHVNT